MYACVLYPMAVLDSKMRVPLSDLFSVTKLDR